MLLRDNQRMEAGGLRTDDAHVQVEAAGMSTLKEELRAMYKVVIEAMQDFETRSSEERMMLLAAGFRTAWGVAWQRAKNAAPPASTSSSTPSTAGYSTTLGIGTDASSTSVSSEVPAPAGAGEGAARFLAVLLRTHALTASQYTALCKECAVPYPNKPQEQDVMRLGHDAVVRVLCGGRS